MKNAPKIFVLDDSPAIVDSIELMMELEGLTISKFYKGSDMMNALEKEPTPEIILTDMWLAGEDGRDICREIKGSEKFGDVAVLIMSASRGLEQSALDAGADAFIAKPFDMHEMIEKVKSYLKIK